MLVHLPTDEAFGLALAEGMAAGLPTVATDIGGCREVVRDGSTGFLVPPGNAEALLAALSTLLDPALGPTRLRGLNLVRQAALWFKTSFLRPFKSRVCERFTTRFARFPAPLTRKIK